MLGRVEVWMAKLSVNVNCAEFHICVIFNSIVDSFQTNGGKYCSCTSFLKIKRPGNSRNHSSLLLYYCWCGPIIYSFKSPPTELQHCQTIRQYEWIISDILVEGISAFFIYLSLSKRTDNCRWLRYSSFNVHSILILYFFNGCYFFLFVIPAFHNVFFFSSSFRFFFCSGSRSLISTNLFFFFLFFCIHFRLFKTIA